MPIVSVDIRRQPKSGFEENYVYSSETGFQAMFYPFYLRAGVIFNMNPRQTKDFYFLDRHKRIKKHSYDDPTLLQSFRLDCHVDSNREALDDLYKQQEKLSKKFILDVLEKENRIKEVDSFSPKILEMAIKKIEKNNEPCRIMHFNKKEFENEIFPILKENKNYADETMQTYFLEKLIGKFYETNICISDTIPKGTIIVSAGQRFFGGRSIRFINRYIMGPKKYMFRIEQGLFIAYPRNAYMLKRKDSC